MGKRIFVMAFSVIVLFFGIQIMADSAIKCADGFEPITHKINNTINIKLCYNKQTGLSYNIHKGGSNNGKYYFYKDWMYCGTNCNFDGANCEEDFCSASYCNQKEGYTQIKYNKDVRFICYNPDTKMGYYPNPNNKTQKEKHRYYINNKRCGEDCDINGTNCRIGYCNPSYCDAEKGYTQIKELEKSYGCYNPDTHISYTFLQEFYIDNQLCGNNCDIDGKNCKHGFCNAETCPVDYGYTQIKSGRCFNPQTQISYDEEFYYYVNDKKCGYKCDINGKNCKGGACFAEECMRKYGYPEIKDGKCYNPKTFLSRELYLGARFWYKSFPCGRDCDVDGRNCKAYGGVKGICNVNDCPKGYKQIVSGNLIDTGMCKKENGDKILVASEKNKFQDYNIYKAKEKAKFGAGVVLAPAILLIHPYD